MKHNLSSLSPLSIYFLCLLCGAVQVFSFAPFNIWPIGIIGLSIFFALLHNQDTKPLLQRVYLFGLGLFGGGIHWVFVSIYSFGGASLFLASLIVLLFSAFLAAVFTLPFYAYARYFSKSPLGFVIALPIIWMLGEWSRTWLLTGFPWLFTGYGFMNTSLAGFGPVVGVCGISALAILTAITLAKWIVNENTRNYKIGLSIVTLAVWITGSVLNTIEWTNKVDKNINIALVQPNLDQGMKLNWTYDTVQESLTQLREQSEPLWQENTWVIWPEAAIPTALTFHTALPFLEEMNRRAAQAGSALFTGIIYDDKTTTSYFNSIVGLGDGLGFYHKRRLVPFGEYVPLENQLRGFIELFDLPTSYISIGPQEQHGLIAHGTRITPAICYEIVYPDLIAQAARETQVLLNVNNLGWFLDSLQSKQFMQMAQMRALETGRYLIYSTNNGPSAIIDPKGKVINQSNAFVAETFTGTISPMSGDTPFMRLSTTGLACFSLLFLLILYFVNIRAVATTEETSDSKN